MAPAFRSYAADPAVARVGMSEPAITSISTVLKVLTPSESSVVSVGRYCATPLDNSGKGWAGLLGTSLSSVAVSLWRFCPCGSASLCLF